MKLPYTPVFIICILLTSNVVFSQSWLKTLGGSSSDVGYAIAEDNNKNVYIGGAFSGTNVDFNPGGTPYYLNTTLGADNGFFAKYNISGVLQWVIPYYRGSGGTRVNSIVTDASNNVYVAGWMDGTNVNFNPNGTAVLCTTNGSQDIFLAKYNSSGILQWVRIMGGPTYSDQATSVAIDPLDNGTILTGQFIDVTNFNPGGTAMTLTPAGGAVAGNSDVFIAKYNTAGICQWIRQIGSSPNAETSNSVATDASGNIFVGGWFLSTGVNFNPGGTAVNKSSLGSGSDLFLAKYNNTGILQWVNVTGGINSDNVSGMAVDGSGNVYATGTFSGSGAPVNFNPNGTSSTLTASGTGDVFLTKYNSSGILQWAKRVGGTGSSDRGRCVAVSTSGNVFFGGQVTGANLDFNPGGTAQLRSTFGGTTDAYLASYTSAGVFNWAFVLGGSSNAENMLAFALENVNNRIFTTGQYSGTTINFDPVNSTPTNASSSSTDAFIAKYGMPSGLLSTSTLPVSWLGITAERKDNSVMLHWETGCEINNNGFTIERSADGNTYNEAGYVISTAGKDCGKASYNFEDHPGNAGEKLYYRLKQTDIDGHYSYSKTVFVSNATAEKYQVQAQPNPAKNRFTITRNGINAPGHAVIYNAVGKLVSRLTLSSYNVVDCSRYAPGVYYINYYNGTELVKTDKMVISR